ncbi:MAG: TlyA family RNA methyltransferase [Spirochaetales bacterium]|nr:TlyA family RNA methyltransferase [Spirochaetales bacterium]
MAKKIMLKDLVAIQAGCTIAAAERKIMAGEVFSGNARLTHPGEKFDSEIKLYIKENCPYVSRGAYKLLKALEVFPLDVKNRVCIDAGSSTGGFTQILLQNEAAKVYAVDCGTNQLDFKLRSDSRVITMENTRIQDLQESDLQPLPQVAVMDVSFTSCMPLVRHLFNILKVEEAAILIKPQFEYKRLQTVLNLSGDFNGVVQHEEEKLKILNYVCDEIREAEIVLAAEPIESPITGTYGNTEYLVYLQRKKA